MPVVAVEKLRRIGEAIYRHHGAQEEEARIAVECLLQANLTGHDSHGVLNIPRYMSLIEKGSWGVPTNIETVRDEPSMAVLDGNWGSGHYIAWRATEMAVEKARGAAIAVVATHHTTHVGRLGQFTEIVARAGMVGIAMANSSRAHQVAPYGGIDRRLCTNPISMAAPSEGEHIALFDVATSVRAAGKLLVAQARGQQVPEGWIIDDEGRPTTDPWIWSFDDKPTGALLPFGGIAGHKGYGLGLLVDLIAGGLSGEGTCTDAPGSAGNGFLIIAIDISKFVPLEEYRAEVAKTIAYMKSSRTAEGFEEVLVAGEPEERTRAERMRAGIDIEESTWEQIDALARRAGVDMD